MRACLHLSLLLLGSATAPLSAQSTVTGIRDLDFGIVIRGVQTAVAPTDPIRSGRYYLSFFPGARVQLRLTLPSTLARVGGGGSMPITFRNDDALVQGTAPGSSPNLFNPGASTNVTLTPNPDANVWLGGRVSPSGTQAAGAYRGTIILTVTVF